MTTAVPPEGLPPPEATAEEVRSAIERILARPEFGDERSLYQRILDWVSERLADVLSLLTGGGRGAVIAWGMLTVATLAVAWIVWRIARDGSLRSGRMARPTAAVSVDDPIRPSAAWRAEADEHAAAGRWREAVRCRWRAMVSLLAERGRLRELPGSTAGDYRTQVRRQAQPIATDFDEATSVFEAAWYGGADVEESDDVAMRAAVEHLASTTARPPDAGSPAAARSGPS